MKLLLRASAGLWLWAFGFSLLYALHGVGCASGWQRVALLGSSLFSVATIALWILVGAAGLATIGWARRAPAGFERRLALSSAIAGLVATLATGAPVVATSACL